MARGKSQKKKPSRKQQGGKDQCNNSMQSWVDRLRFVPICREHGASNDEMSLSIISWNVLAESYCSRRSHPGLPRKYQEVVFDPYRRGRLIKKVLVGGPSSEVKDTTEDSVTDQPHLLMPDIWALQEVDRDEILSKHLSSVGYDGIETPRMKLGGGAGGKVDSCGIYYRKDRWNRLEDELIRLDELAHLPASSSIQDAEVGTIESINNNLRGLQQSFLRRNVALLLRMQSTTRPDITVVVAVAHLFWNPLYEYIKLCQIHHIMIKAKQFQKSDNEPFIFCGDLNSLPGSSVHAYLSKGVVNAKTVAPWYRFASEKASEKSEDDSDSGVDGLTAHFSCLRISTSFQPKPIRYLLDYNLNRLCRWFRILGLDAGLETEEEERLRTKEGKIRLFDRCRAEHRILITTSNSLLSRTNCPPGTYLINPKSLANNWEIILVHILLTHGVHINPSKFLTRCVVCNGAICSVHDLDLKRKIFADHQAPFDGNSDLAVFQCDGCQQGYWWCDRPQSSASRVKGQATRLYQMCLRAHVPVSASTQKHMFEHVNEQEERIQGWDWKMRGSELLRLKLEVAEWLKDEQLSCPMRRLQSAYKDDNNESGESTPYTNVTRDFEGCLDYIFFDAEAFKEKERLFVPKTHEELNFKQLKGGHLLPSDVWPSDHLAVGSTLQLRS